MKEDMVENKDYELNDIAEMKKPHPCATKSKQFEIIRLGADIKIFSWKHDYISTPKAFDFNICS